MRAEFNRATRQAALKRSGGLCEASGTRYGLAEGLRCNQALSGAEFDHDVPDALAGLNDLDNCRAVCKSCHRWKTSNVDVPSIRKADRIKAKREGTWVGSGAKLRSRGFGGNRDQAEVILREARKATL